MKLGYFFAIVTAIVLMEPVVSGRETLTVSHLLTVTALVATIAACHSLQYARSMVHGAALMVIAVAGILYTVVSAGSRNAEVVASRMATAKQPEVVRQSIEKNLLEQKVLLKDAFLAAAGECSSGKGTKCDGRMAIVAFHQSQVDALENRLNAAPVASPTGYAQTAKLWTHLFGGDPLAVEMSLALTMPYVIVVLCEIATIVFMVPTVSSETPHETVTVSSVSNETPMKLFNDFNMLAVSPPVSNETPDETPETWIKTFQSDHGVLPSVTEVQKRFALSRSTAWRKIKSA